ncbi:MAG TPA: TerB family tellurite resistance protein [Vicinamibacteria bacterium]|nr:TerB family tellurite resistance protein [Vicinamibacteria bacterium]
MIRTIQEFFTARIIYDDAPPDSLEQRLQLATAALLIEVSRADFELADEERYAIVDALQKSFGLTADETRELVALAEIQVGQSISLYQFASLCDKGFTPEQKKHIVGLLWAVALSDERLDVGEEYLIRKIAKLLHVSHRDFIDEKLRAKASR